MTQRLTILVAVVMVSFSAAALWAHDNFRVIGTVTRVEASSLDVKNKDLKTTSIRIDKQTTVTRDKKKIPISELRVGQSVIVDAYGDSEADLLALEVRIVPPIQAR
jgi:hypothetical protein